MSVTQAINKYGLSSFVSRVCDVMESYRLSKLHHRFFLSIRFQKYLGISQIHLREIGNELERRCKLYCGDSFQISNDNNPGNYHLKQSIVSAADLLTMCGDLEICIPAKGKNDSDNFGLFHDLMEFQSKYQWYQENHMQLPGGEELLNEAIREMEQVLKGRLEGRQPWHVLNSKN